MRWLAAWWQQIVGGPTVEPWESDPRIKAERIEQHERMNAASRITLRDAYHARMKQAWKAQGGNPPPTAGTDAGG